MSIFDKFNSAIDGEALVKDIAEVSANNTQADYKEVPFGNYEVKVEKMEIGECKSGNNAGMPMFKAQFRILTGEFKNSCLFMNQLLVKAYPIHKTCEFLRSLDSDVNVEFDGNYEHFNNTILDVHEAIDGKLEYGLKYYDNKGFNAFEITEVFDAE